MPQTRRSRDGPSKPRGKAGTGKPRGKAGTGKPRGKAGTGKPRGKAGAGRPKRGPKTNRQIAPPKLQGMEGEIFVGLDVHWDTIQMCVMDVKGAVLFNEKMDNTPEKIRYHIGNIPRAKARLVIESSSIWKAPFFQIRDELGMGVVLSHPYATKLIARSKKKTAGRMPAS